MKYQLYVSNSIEHLDESAQPFGEAESYQNACRLIAEHINTMGWRDSKYWRYLMTDSATFIDFGSWSNYFFIPEADNYISSIVKD